MEDEGLPYKEPGAGYCFGNVPYCHVSFSKKETSLFFAQFYLEIDQRQVADGFPPRDSDRRMVTLKLSGLAAQ